MAGSESAKVADAFISIRARDDGVHGDVERIGREYGSRAGRAAARDFNREFEKGLDRDVRVRARAGVELGEQIGDPAGKSAGTSLSEGITDSLARSKQARQKDGDQLGRNIGEPAGERAGATTASGISDALRAARSTWDRDGRSIGEALGQSAGRHAAAAAGGALRAELAAEAKAQVAEEKARAAEARAAERLASAAARVEAATARAAAKAARDEVAAARVREREATRAAAAAAKARKDFRSAIGDALKGADRITNALGRGARGYLKAASGIVGIAAAATGLGNGINATVGAIISLSGAVGVLPAVAVGAGTALVALKIGLSGVGDALKNNGDPKKYAEDLKKLAPAAQDFVKAIVKMKPALTDVKKSIQGGLFKGLDKEATALGNRYLPIVQRGLTGTARAFNVAARDVGEFLDKSSTARDVTGIFNDINKAGGKLAFAIKPAAGALLDFVAVGSDFLPSFADHITDASKRFRVFVDNARDTGQLKRFFSNGIDAVGDLGSSFKAIGRIIGNVFKAGQGASTTPLQTLSDLLNKIADTVGSAPIQAGLTRFFESIAQTGAQLGDKIQQLGEALVTLEPTLSSLVRGAGAALPSVLTAAAGAAKTLAPFLESLSGAIEKIAPHAGDLVLALVGVKIALLGLRFSAGIVTGLIGIRDQFRLVRTAAVLGRQKILDLAGAFDTLTGAEVRARFAAITFRSALKGLGFAAIVVGVAAVANKLGPLIAKIGETKVPTDKLAASLDELGNTGKLGQAGLDLFSRGLGPFHKSAKDTAAAIDAFGVSAGNAFGNSITEKINRASSFGGALQDLKDKASQLDPAFASLAKTDPLGASQGFQKFIDAGVKAGATTEQLTKLFPQYAAAVAASGASTDTTAGKVQNLTQSLGSLITATDTYANKALGAEGAASNYQAALDAATAAAKRNGKGLSLNTEKGRENRQALRDIVTSGIETAKFFAGDGPNSQAKFRASLLTTRSALIAAARKFGDTKKEAVDYADSILQIPSKASTTVTTPGLNRAASRVDFLSGRLNDLPTHKNISVTTSFYQRGKAPGSFGNGVGVLKKDGGLIAPVRRAPGGFVDPSLGAPRQDNVPLLVSGGEFVVNAFATAAAGVLPLLRSINTANRLPKFASGGQVARRASAGMSDLTSSAPARIERVKASRQVASSVPDMSGLADSIALAVATAVRQATRGMSINVDGNQLASVVYQAGGGL